MSGSQVRKRGQARVHSVQPLRPWVQLSGPPSAVDVEGPVDPVLVVVAEDVVGADDDTGGAPRAQPGRHDLGEQLGPLRLLGRHWPTIFGLGGSGRIPCAGARDPRSRALPGQCRSSAAPADHPGVDGRLPLRPRRDDAGAAPVGARRPLLQRGPAHRQAAAARHRRGADPGPALRHDGRPGGRRQRGARPAALRTRCLQREVGAGPLHLRGRGRAPDARPAPLRVARAGARRGPAGPRRAHGVVGRAAGRPGHRAGTVGSGGAAQGALHGPGTAGRRGQPAGRRDPLPGRAGTRTGGRRSPTRSSASCTSSCARRCASWGGEAARTWAT